jgi:hypothetical protein
MPQPTARDLQVVDPLLTNISVAWMQADKQFVADKVFPVVESDVQGGKFAIYNRGDWLRAEARVRAPGTESAGGGWTVTSDSFFIDIISVHKDLDDPTKAVARSRAGGVFNLESDATKYVSQQLRLKQELQFQDKFFKSGVWGRERTGVASGPTGTQFLRWDLANSTPIDDIQSEIIVMAELTGYTPNTLVITPYVRKALARNAQLIALIQYGGGPANPAVITDQAMAAVFGVEQVLTMWGIQNTAAEGATDAYGFIGGKHALLTYAAPNPSTMQPSAGYTFAWTGYPGTGAGAVRIKNFRMEALASDRIEGEYAREPKKVSSELGTFFITAVT